MKKGVCCNFFLLCVKMSESNSAEKTYYQNAEM